MVTIINHREDSAPPESLAELNEAICQLERARDTITDLLDRLARSDQQNRLIDMQAKSQLIAIGKAVERLHARSERERAARDEAREVMAMLVCVQPIAARLGMGQVPFPHR